MARINTKNKKINSSKFNIASNNSRIAKNTILAVIVAATLAIIGFFVYNLIATPEYIVKREINNIAKDYYENYFYPTLLKNNSLDPEQISNSPDGEDIMTNIIGRYVDRGFSIMSIRQLLLYDNLKHIDSTKTIQEYCDLDNSFIKFYPEPPYMSNNFRTEINYSCNFKQ